MMRRSLLALVFILTVFLFANSATAGTQLAVTPGYLGISYVPGQTSEFRLFIEGSPYEELALEPSGELGQYLSLSVSDLTLDSQGRGQVTFQFTTPAIEMPGDHSAVLFVKEKPPLRGFGEPAPMIVTVAAIGVPVVVNVPCPDRCIGLTFSADDADSGKSAFFSAQISNLGSKEISSLSGHIEILDSTNATVATIPFASAGTLAPGGNTILHSEWDTAGADPGVYTAKAVVLYDEFSKDATDDFKVGTLLVKLVDLSPRQFSKGDVANINVQISSVWNKPINNIYAVLHFKNVEGNELAKVTTPTLSSIGAWSTASLSALIDIRTQPAGNYTISAALFYEGGNSTKDFPVSIVEQVQPQKAEFKPDTTLIVMVLLLIFILVLAYLRKEKARKTKHF